MPIHRGATVYDVCIVGSGAGGGMAAHELTAGRRERRDARSRRSVGQHQRLRHVRRSVGDATARRATHERPFGEHDGCIGGWNLPGEPFTTAPGTQFQWWRARMLGGRTNHWGRISLRFGPDDFRHKSRRRPRRRLADLATTTWRRITTMSIAWSAIFGSRGGAAQSSGRRFPAAAQAALLGNAGEEGGRQAERHLHSFAAVDPHPAAQRPPRMSLLRPVQSWLPGQRELLVDQRADRSRRCDTGKLTLHHRRDGARSDRRFRRPCDWRGVHRQATRDARSSVDARIVVLAASACEIGAHPAEFHVVASFRTASANSSGVVGKYITDTTGTDVGGYIPSLVDQPRHNCDGVGGAHLYMPWWLDNKKLDFPRGYHIEIWGGMGMPGYGFMGGIQSYPPGGGYGASLKNDYRKYWGATIGFSRPRRNDPQRGFVLRTRSAHGRPMGNSRAALSLEVDRPRIPADRSTCRKRFARCSHEMGAEVWSTMPTREQGYGISTGGSIIHEVGGVRMGSIRDDQRAQRQLPGVGLSQPLRRRRRAVHHAGRQESDLDHPRAVDAHVALHRRRTEGGKAVTRPVRARPQI